MNWIKEFFNLATTTTDPFLRFLSRLTEDDIYSK
ncbi:MAG: hypothetical protein JWQ54_3790 [Mucilaginibacter sp.]|nr:hypothetical protein [Mucilaginibacter sp.]